MPPADERPVAQAVLAMLEDRRVLYRPYEMEDRHHSLVSVDSIRKALTEALGQVSQESRLAMHLRGMRAACRRFMDEMVGSPSHRRWHFEDISFGIALGELRSAMGPHIAAIAVAFNFDVEDELAKMLPPVDDQQ